jgi:hypothetical protein
MTAKTTGGLTCYGCKAELSVVQVLESGKFAFLEQGWIGFDCPRCTHYWIAEVSTNTLAIGDIDGGPGPCFMENSKVEAPGLTVNRSGNRLSCDFGGKKFSFKAR